MSREQKSPGFILDGAEPIAANPDAEAKGLASSRDAGVFGNLPAVGRLQVALARLLKSDEVAGRLRLALMDGSTDAIRVDVPDIRWRPSGLRRPGVVAEFVWPRLATRLALGVDTPLAHAIVDHLLGFDRQPAEENLQVTPVEWGILTHVAARFLKQLQGSSGRLGPHDLRLDRVGPDPFDPAGLGQLCTIRWHVHLSNAAGSLRLWLPETILLRALSEPTQADDEFPAFDLLRLPDLGGRWLAEAGSITLGRGLGMLRVGGVMPIDAAPLQGTVASPSGTVRLALDDRDGRSIFLADVEPGSAGARVRLSTQRLRVKTPRGPLAVATIPDPDPIDGSSPPAAALVADIPVTLVVELGRVNLSLGRVANLKPGDVVELGRNPREPVELTSNGRLVARGELVQLDSELAVRLTNVFL